MSHRRSFPEPPHYDAVSIRAIRGRLGWSQAQFAAALNVSLATVRHWEQGLRAPDGGHLRLLEVADRTPDALAATVTAREELDP